VDVANADMAVANADVPEGNYKENHKKPNSVIFSCDYMALGRLQEAAKYSHGVWEEFADLFRDVQKWVTLG